MKTTILFLKGFFKSLKNNKLLFEVNVTLPFGAFIIETKSFLFVIAVYLFFEIRSLTTKIKKIKIAKKERKIIKKKVKRLFKKQKKKHRRNSVIGFRSFRPPTGKRES